MRDQVIGVYPVDAQEPCHLLELLVTSAPPPDFVRSVTQEAPGEPRDNWQVPWDERLLDLSGEREIHGPGEPPTRIAFFFHYLSLDRPLTTSAGPLPLPAPTARPVRIDFIDYEPPC